MPSETIPDRQGEALNHIDEIEEVLSIPCSQHTQHNSGVLFLKNRLKTRFIEIKRKGRK